MLLSPDVMRAFLMICLFGMALLAAFYLRRRSLTLIEYISWGMLLILLPLIGPFLVIMLRPGAGRDSKFY